jgi:hypothetical protein
MISEDTLVWTTRGWRRYHDLMIGERIISYNPSKNYCEYDHVSSIETDYMKQMFLTIKHKSIHMYISQDHPLSLYDEQYKTYSRVSINDVFGRNLKLSRNVLYNRPFEPYRRSQDLEDVRWSARIAASYCKLKNFDEYPEKIFDIIKDITCVEAREWIDTFYHWNVKIRSSPAWMFSTCLRNKLVRDMIFHVAPRAGVGALWASVNREAGPDFNIMKSPWAMRISNISDARIALNAGWGKKSYSGVCYNISTKNGTFLAKRWAGTFLMSCNIKEV